MSRAGAGMQLPYPDDSYFLDAPGHMPNLYSEEQRRALEAHFRMDTYPSLQTRQALAARLNLKESHVQLWFIRRQTACLRLLQPLPQVQRLQGLRPLPPPKESTHFLFCYGYPTSPAAALKEKPKPSLEGQGSPGATPLTLRALKPRPLGSFGTLPISARTPRFQGFQEGLTPEDQEKPGSNS